jgi:DNA-binding response OmpR family regulator
MAKILLIEDSKDVAEMLTLLLGMKSHVVETAFSIKEAKQKIDSLSFDIILVDVLLGSDNGKDLCREIRSMDKKVPIILMSANPSLLKDYAECEANAIMEKPFNIKEITDQINKFLKPTPAA